MNPVLKIRGLRVEFSTPQGPFPAVDGVDLEVMPGETLGLVGESGCGKTTLARAVLGLQPYSGEIEVLGKRVQGVERDNAKRVGMVWQDPYASLNPRWRISESLMEPARIIGERADVDQLLDLVGLDRTFSERYPHELSGGQRQRVAIARALAAKPPLVLCDEPTAALDLSVRAQILNLLRSLLEQHERSFLYISHDLTTVRFLADRVAVMYLGRIVEVGPAEQVFSNPAHPYTRALVDSVPSLETLGLIPPAPAGETEDPRRIKTACRFAPRCPRRTEVCLEVDPPLEPKFVTAAACHHPLQPGETLREPVKS